MNAKRCDRCMCFFDPEDGRGDVKTVKFQNPIFTTWSDAKQGKYTHFFDDKYPDRYVDLCPKCTNDFIEFMDFPNHRLGYIQEYESEIDDLRDMLEEGNNEKNSLKHFIEDLVGRVFGVTDLTPYLNRKQDKDVNGDPKGGSNKHQGG